MESIASLSGLGGSGISGGGVMVIVDVDRGAWLCGARKGYVHAAESASWTQAEKQNPVSGSSPPDLGPFVCRVEPFGILITWPYFTLSFFGVSPGEKKLRARRNAFQSQGPGGLPPRREVWTQDHDAGGEDGAPQG